MTCGAPQWLWVGPLVWNVMYNDFLGMDPEKTEALLVTDRRSFQHPKIVLREHEVEWKKSIKYLDVQLDRRLSFGEHLQIATAKAI